MRKNSARALIAAAVPMCLLLLGATVASQEAPEFSGDLVITAPDSVVKARVYVQGPLVHRVEMAQEAGGAVFIRPPRARGKVWMLDPARKQFRVLSWPQKHRDPVEAWTDIQYDMTGGPQGKETVDGRHCTVLHFRYLGRDETTLKVWFAEELQYAVKMEADAQVAVESAETHAPLKGTYEIVNIRTRKLEDALFEIPSDYREAK